MRGKINQLVLKIAELCNLNCSYCYLYKHEDHGYRLRPKFMSEKVFEQVLTRVCEYCDRWEGHQMALIFHGGEPTLVGRDRLAWFAGRAYEVLGDRLQGLAMQTNGTLLDTEWVGTIRKCRIQVGVSLDGPAAIHDVNRVDFAGRGSHAAATRALRVLQDAGMSPSILCVVSPGCSGREIYQHFRSLGVHRMDFLLPDATHDTRRRFYGAYDGTPIADYLIPIFDEWFAEDDPSVKIRLFLSLISALVGGTTESDQLGNPTCCYLVIETNGSIQANDVLRICADGMADSGLNVFQHSFDDLAQGLPLLYNMVHQGMPLSATCQACRERDICGGGYLPHRYSRANGFNNPSVWCADLLRLINHIRTQVENACRV
jgi:uncharacterized protein